MTRAGLASFAVIGNPPGRCGLLPDKVVDDPPRLRDSVRALLALDFNTFLVGDGEPILRNAKERLRELVDPLLKLSAGYPSYKTLTFDRTRVHQKQKVARRRGGVGGLSHAGWQVHSIVGTDVPA